MKLEDITEQQVNDAFFKAICTLDKTPYDKYGLSALAGEMSRHLQVQCRVEAFNREVRGLLLVCSLNGASRSFVREAEFLSFWPVP